MFFVDVVDSSGDVVSVVYVLYVGFGNVILSELDEWAI